MSVWNVINNPSSNVTGNWTTNPTVDWPEFIATGTPPYSRFSFRMTATGVRPGYKGPIGWLHAGVYDIASSTAVWFPSERCEILANTWYHFGTQVGGLGDYMWSVQRAGWVILAAGFWSNGRAAGGTWRMLTFND